jgi:hypothetical protein
MERVSHVESKRMNLSEEERKAILKVSQDPERYKQVEAMMIDLFGYTVGILSLTEKPDNLLMWAHYAAEHTGFLIGFDTSHAYWNNFGDERGNSHVGVLRKVAYSETRPSPEHLAAMSLEQVYFTKSREWEYEQEWRVFRNVQQCDHAIEFDNAPPVCLFNFPKDSVLQIIIGCRASDETAKAIADIVKGTKEYEKTELLRAEIDPSAFKLNISPL